MAIEFMKNMNSNRNSNQQYCLHIKREKLTIFFLKKPSSTKRSPPFNAYYMEFYCNFF